MQFIEGKKKERGVPKGEKGDLGEEEESRQTTTKINVLFKLNFLFSWICRAEWTLNTLWPNKVFLGFLERIIMAHYFLYFKTIFKM